VRVVSGMVGSRKRRLSSPIKRVRTHSPDTCPSSAFIAAQASIVMLDEHGGSSESTEAGAFSRSMRATRVRDDDDGGEGSVTKVSGRSLLRRARPAWLSENEQSALLEESRVKLEPFEEGLAGGRMNRRTEAKNRSDVIIDGRSVLSQFFAISSDFRDFHATRRRASGVPKSPPKSSVLSSRWRLVTPPSSRGMRRP
jgi:hypothetical protein